MTEEERQELIALIAAKDAEIAKLQDEVFGASRLVDMYAARIKELKEELKRWQV